MQVSARPRSAPPRVLVTPRRVLRGLAAHDAFKSAAAVAFWFFLSLVPLLVLVGFVVGQVARRRGVHALTEPLLQVVPLTAEDLVRGEIERLTGSRASLAPLGVLGYLWAASSGVHNLLDAFERAVQARRRPWWSKRLSSLGWVIAGLAVACATAWCLVRVDARWHVRAAPADARSSAAAARAPPSASTPESSARGESAARADPRTTRAHGEPHDDHADATAPKPLRRPRSLLEQSIDAALVLGVGTGFLGVFYRFSVPSRARRRHVWPGTIASVGCWLLVSWAFSAYTASMAQYALFYGSLAAVAVLLVWLYLTSLSFMVGIEVNAMLERSPQT